ncbi:MAG TPA: thymidylate kinase [Acidobacteriota bacterium]|jgi:dTMP kinase|nr:thymidylate kinase [Acidobacteriota bacterium]HNR38820.1 thymidylate kinase [Acidobacteriota bacterium]HNU00341.1 thymidylate kinase [Acidobacteriota bacterium]HPB27209.1 thymidylate kinase [Acidobacteriota bacterium]HQO25014.1 thymidylate kinase [Acidobacteriota bacterium]
MPQKRCYVAPPPGVEPSKLGGLLVVVEGPDSSGRSTQTRLLSEWLEQKGFAVSQVGLKRSALVSAELENAMMGNVLSPRTMSLFYATDFYDQLENSIVPALRAGSIVLADRYIFTLIARDVVRGANPEWTEMLYSRALVPDAVYYLTVSPRSLVERTLQSHGCLDYWESGMDIGHSRDWFESFVWYQRRIREEFRRLEQRFRFETINANRSVRTTQNDLRKRIEGVLQQALAKL